MTYCIVDVETTGGKFDQEGITEIAIYKYDGHQIVDQFCSLINPEKPITPYVVKLTGITDKMLITAPKFYEVAKRIIEITEDSIFVAHNVNFDYRIVRTEFKRLGYSFKKETLCTVELSRKLIPDQPSYSLGKLVKNLGIPITSRHRASGDAMATVKLFSLLLQKDAQKSIIQEHIKKTHNKGFTPKLLDIVESLPESIGVYYMHDIDGQIIYIGKSKNIKNRISQHFASETKKSKKIQHKVHSVTYELTGNELIALLKESEDIKIHKPIFNVRQRKSIFEYGLYKSVNQAGYICLNIAKLDNRKSEITSFTSFQEARSFLFHNSDKFQLCQKLNNLYETKHQCFQYELKTCLGACINQEPVEDYNNRAQELLSRYETDFKNMIVIDKGRYVEERTAVLIENGIYKGYCFYDLNFQINHLEVLKSMITPMTHNRDTARIIKGYLKKYPRLKIIRF